VAVLAKH